MRIRCALFLLLLAALPVRGQSPLLVRDINPSTWNYGTLDATEESEAVGNLFFFDLDDGIHGEELWRSDGSPSGTSLVKDLYSGPGSLPLPIMDGGGRLFFTVQDTVKELWVTEGAASGTSRVGIPAGSGYVSHLLASGNGKLLFAVYGSTTGLEPWITDGTVAGTHAVADLNPDFGDSLRTYNPADFGKIAVAAPWIERLAADGITGGYFCPDRPVTRAEMAVFLTSAFHLPLP